MQFVAGLFRLDAKEPRRCSAFGTAGPFNGIRNVACAAGRWSQRPLTIGLTKGACEVVERNNYLASEPGGIPIELQLTLKLGWTTRPTTRVPKPWRLGGLTGGPPASDQRITSCVSPRDHSTRSRPEGTDRAPYLTAFVVNSCRTIAIVCADFGFQNEFRTVDIRARHSL